jgi:hypothetical protein
MRPELITIGPVTIYSYGLMLGLAFLAGALLAAKEADRKGIDRERFFDFLLITLVVAVVVSRLFYVALQPEEYLAAPATILNIRDGGLAFHGGLLGGGADGPVVRQEAQSIVLADRGYGLAFACHRHWNHQVGMPPRRLLLWGLVHASMGSADPLRAWLAPPCADLRISARLCRFWLPLVVPDPSET